MKQFINILDELYIYIHRNYNNKKILSLIDELQNELEKHKDNNKIAILNKKQYQ